MISHNCLDGTMPLVDMLMCAKTNVSKLSRYKVIAKNIEFPII